MWDTREYDEHTGNLTRQTTDRETGPARIDDIRYTFDQANNITKLETASGQDAQRSVDTQCFTTDALRRITNAWTATDGCTAKPNADGSANGTTPKVGGPDAYWHTFTYDAVGNRQTETQHKVDGNPLATDDVKRTYQYGQDGAGKRQLTGVTQTTAGKTGTRYYTQDTQTIAVKTRGEMSVLLSDHHGTATTAVLLATGQALTRRKKTIFGGDRTAQPATWPGTKGFVGGTQDPTGLTHLGAREYDPHLGRFISVDPVIDTGDPQQMHGYTYGNNNPLIHSDPDGKLFGGNNSSLWMRPGAKDPYANSGPRSPAEYERRNNQNRQRSNPNYSPYKTTQGSKRTSYQNHGPWSPKVYKQRKADADAAARDKKAAKDKKRKHDVAMKERIQDKRSGLRKLWDSTGGKAVSHVKDHWRGYAEAAAFGICVAASAGACIVAGAAVAGAKWFASYRDPNTARYGFGDFAKDTLVGLGGGLAGGAIGRGLSRGMSGSGITFRQAMWSNAFSGSAAQKYANMSLNAKMAVVGCGAGGFNPGYC
ncbi:RHS repeat-associated core domain-containing protein [Streptomyces sp. HUAS TT7]|uniref:RHS repeat-associated core domain-containing protein n=1 Tax=Streptomyces sp. HUAS TT7 TaxID=3447507 RepID=UPI003F65CC29